MPFTNNGLWVCVLCWACSSVHALAEPMTVESAIAIAKQKKSQSAVAKSDSLPAALLTPINTPLPVTAVDPPKLWSIKGINGNHQAEIIYNQKIFLIPLVVGGQFESWEIVAFDTDSLTLKKRHVTTTNAKQKVARPTHDALPLKLFVAPSGHPIGSYQILRGNDINTLPRRVAADLPLVKN